jgi:hypothetical protein
MISKEARSLTTAETSADPDAAPSWKREQPAALKAQTCRTAQSSCGPGTLSAEHRLTSVCQGERQYPQGATHEDWCHRAAGLAG